MLDWKDRKGLLYKVRQHRAG